MSAPRRSSGWRRLLRPALALPPALGAESTGAEPAPPAAGCDHFQTPLGVVAHGLDNPDFRAEGTCNEHHIRGYGARGMRAHDFGREAAERGGGGQSVMRLQMHATDRATLEPRPGRPVSKGCIRIPATLNTFLDVHGVLDADSEAALAGRESLWALRAERQPVPWPGRYLVIVEPRGGDAALLTASTAGAASGCP